MTMKIAHKNLHTKWNSLSLPEQMSNIGSEVGRIISWRNKDSNQSRFAFYRALELLDFTINDKKNKKSLKEILRVREILADYFIGENQYGITDEDWNKYFLFFNFLARKDK